MIAWQDEDALLAVAEGVVARAGAGEQVEAVVAAGRDTEVRAFEGEVESLSSATSTGVGVRVVVDGRTGFAWAGTLDPEVVAETLEEARHNATFATPDEHAGLAEPDGVAPAPLELWSEELAAHPTEAKVATAIELEGALRAADPRITGIESAEYVDFLATSAIASTTGVRATTREGGCYLAAYALASDGAETQTGFGYSIGRDPADLDISAVAADASSRATRLLGASKPPSGSLPVVLDPWVTAQLLGIVGHTLDGEAVLKGRSPFADRLGEQIAAPVLSFADDPTDPAAFTATAIDGEGLATRRNPLVDAGDLQMFLYDATSARRAGTSSTGSAVRGGVRATPGVGCQALVPQPGDTSPEALIAGIDDGVLVLDVSGLHSGVNPVSGDLSTGAEGIRIRGGELAEPLREFTIASTLQRLLADIVAVGDDLRRLPMTASGVSLVVGAVTVSGT